MIDVNIPEEQITPDKERLMELIAGCKDPDKLNYLADVMELQQMLDSASKRSA